MKYITLLFIAILSHQLFAQKIKYSINNGLQIEGVDGTNAVILDNDIAHDSPDLHYLWLRANRGEVKLVGNIATRDMHPQGESRGKHWPRWVDFHNKAVAAGLKNIPKPIQGAGGTGASGQHLTKPASGNIDETVFQNNAGSDLIIAEAKKASAAKPLVIFVGGNVSTVANAYLKDKSIVDKIVVLHYAGYVVPGGTYNTMDKWATYVVMKRMKYIVVSGDQYTYYNGQKPVPTTVNLSGMPANPFTKTLLDNWVGQYYATYKEAADAPPVLYFFNHGVIKNVVRKLENGQTTTSDTFDFLLVSQNDWAYLKSNAWLDYIRNPANHVPGSGTTPPPVNNPPTVTTTMGALFNAGPVTLTASASDSDGTVSKVEFLVNGSKVGEDTSSPYSLVQTFVPGSYGIQARAIDNLGAVGNSPTLIITVVGPTEPPDSTNCIICPAGPQGVAGPQGPQGIPGPEGPMGPQGPPGSGTGTGSVLRTVFNVETYGANGADNAPDTKGFQDAINAAIAVNGLVWWPAAQNYWNIDNTLQIVPRSGQSQCWIDIYGQGSVQQMRWTGGNNKPVFRIVGLKNGSIEGVKISLSGTGVTAFDIVTTATSNSSTSVKFENFRINLGDGIDNIGVRMGEENGGNGDLSHYSFISGGVYGSGALKGQGDPILGQYAFVNYGHNTLANTFVNCFVAQTDRFYTNISRDGTKRGNSSVTFFGCGGAHVGDLFVTAWQGQYSVIGGRFENGHRTFFKVAAYGGYQHVTIIGPEVKDFGAPGGTIIDIQQACSFKLENVVLTNGRSNVKFTNPIKLSSNGRVGNLKIEGGGILSDAVRPYTKTGTTVWNITVDGVARMGDSSANGNIYSTTLFDNEFGVRK